MIKRLKHISLRCALAASLVAVLYSDGVLYGIHRDNDLIRQLTFGRDVVNQVISGKPELRLA